MDNFKLELKLREIPDGRWKGMIEAVSLQYLCFTDGSLSLLGGVGTTQEEAIINATTSIVSALAQGAHWHS